MTNMDEVKICGRCGAEDAHFECPECEERRCGPCMSRHDRPEDPCSSLYADESGEEYDAEGARDHYDNYMDDV